MPYVKCISGHTSAHAVQRYLEAGGRALATDFLNIDAPVSGVRDNLEDHGRIDWWREMDRPRASFGNDAAWNGQRARTWKHYILSPNPTDGIELSRLRRLATERRFYEVAREALLSATIDVEHFAKMRLLRMCEEYGEDGYAIVSDYLASISSKQRTRIESALRARGGNGRAHDEYSGDLIAHYAGGYPVWVFLEVIDFGTFADLWRRCASRWDSSEMRAQHYVLKSVRALRNACAHNSLIVNGFSRHSERTTFNPPRPISASLNERGMKNTKARRSKLANLRVSQSRWPLLSGNRIYPNISQFLQEHVPTSTFWGCGLKRADKGGYDEKRVDSLPLPHARARERQSEERLPPQDGAERGGRAHVRGTVAGTCLLRIRWPSRLGQITDLRAVGSAPQVTFYVNASLLFLHRYAPPGPSARAKRAGAPLSRGSCRMHPQPACEP